MQYHENQQKYQNESEAAYEPRQVNRDPREQRRSIEENEYKPGYMGQPVVYGEKIQPGMPRPQRRKRQNGQTQRLLIGILILVVISVVLFVVLAGALFFLIAS